MADQDTSMLWGTSELALVLAMLTAFFTVTEVGFRLGRRYRASAEDPLKAHVGAPQGALLLGFTFAMAVAHFDTRKGLVFPLRMFQVPLIT